MIESRLLFALGLTALSQLSVAQPVAPLTTFTATGTTSLSTSAGTVTSIDRAAPAGPAGFTPDEIRNDPFRSRTGLGAAPKLNMRIEGDGIGLPTGVGQKNQDQAKTNPDRDASGEKSKPADPVHDKAKDLAKTGGTGIQKPPSDGSEWSNSGADGKEGRPANEKPRRGDRPTQEGGNGENIVVTPSQSPTTREAAPIVQRMERGLERDPEIARPTNIKLKESGVALPACTSESREGVACGQAQ